MFITIFGLFVVVPLSKNWFWKVYGICAFSINWIYVSHNNVNMRMLLRRWNKHKSEILQPVFVTSFRSTDTVALIYVTFRPQAKLHSNKNVSQPLHETRNKDTLDSESELSHFLSIKFCLKGVTTSIYSSTCFWRQNKHSRLNNFAKYLQI